MQWSITGGSLDNYKLAIKLCVVGNFQVLEVCFDGEFTSMQYNNTVLEIINMLSVSTEENRKDHCL